MGDKNDPPGGRIRQYGMQILGVPANKAKDYKGRKAGPGRKMLSTRHRTIDRGDEGLTCLPGTGHQPKRASGQRHRMRCGKRRDLAQIKRPQAVSQKGAGPTPNRYGQPFGKMLVKTHREYR